MDYKHLLEEVEKYVKDYFHTHQDSRLVYHNLQHTKEVVKATQQIANHYQLNDNDFCIVVAAAWFHDTGYFIDPSNHEAKGAELANDYLEKLGMDETSRQTLMKAIRSTKIPQSPENLLEKILCDGDLFHLGTEEFRKTGKLMHKEVELIYNKDISKLEWRKRDIAFMESHHYHTDYCNLLLNDQKQKNIEKLKNKLKEEEVSNTISQTETKTEKSQASAKIDKPERGIETMFRITSANNQRLSDMADNKAQILITVNSIILSLIVSLLLSKIDHNNFLAIPTLILLLVSLSCVVVSILSTRPSIPEGVFDDSDLNQKRVNLLFFGNFYKMSLQSYKDGMDKVMNDKEFLYGTLITDVYSQGVVLGRKYKLIRLAYNIFMFGLITSVLAFILSYLNYNQLI